MVNRDQIETILKINGVVPGSPDEKIRSVLLSARYSKDEVDTAIMVLRENTKTNVTRVDGLHKIFRTDEALKPEEISQLLGIDVDISERVTAKSKVRDLSLFQYIIVWSASAVLAVAGLILYMYLHEVGLFHPAGMLSAEK
jgi:hypothetical protein